MSARRILAALPILGLVLVLVPTACATGKRPSFADEAVPIGELPAGTSRLTSVTVVGDSITALSEELLRADLATVGLTRVKVDAVPGRRIEVGNGSTEPLSGVTTVSTLVALGEDPQVWVIALGTNDLGSYADQAAYGVVIGRVLDLLPADVPVVWVDVCFPARAGPMAEFNAALRERATTRPDTTVVSWAGLACAPGADLLSSDGVHPSEAGADAFAALIAQALQRL